MNIISALLIIAIATFASSSDAGQPDLAKLPPASKTAGLTYAKDIRPIFAASCFRCHGEQRSKACSSPDSLEGALKSTEDGKVIIPGKSQESQLVLAVARLDEKTAMPPKPGKGRSRGPSGPPPNPPTDGKAPARPDGVPDGGPRGGPPSAPSSLTPEQVGIIRAWVDQGAK